MCIRDKVEDMARGRINEIELENTRRGLINQLRAGEDSPYQFINRQLDGEIGGKQYTTDEMIRAIAEVGPEEITAAAERVRLDTVYLLRGEEGVAADGQ